VLHGDVYLHNTLRVDGGSEDGTHDDVRLSDLGAAAAYDRLAHPQLERIEVRSYGKLVEDLLSWCEVAEGAVKGIADGGVAAMEAVVARCTREELAEVPTFEEVLALYSSYGHA